MENQTRELTLKVKQTLKELGVPAHLLGYEYLTKAIMMCVLSNKRLFMGEIYNEISKEFDTTYTRAERAIRHAIEVSILRANERKYNSVFAWTVDSEKGKPNNSEYVFGVVDYIKNFI